MANKRKELLWKKTVVGGAVLLAVSTAGTYWKSTQPVPAYTVARVIDGDTFETTEKQLIRLAELDAPEVGLCQGKEAKEELTKLLMGKPVYLKVMYRDHFKRLESYVYTPEVFVNAKMAETGNGIYRMDWKKSDQTIQLSKAQEMARKNKVGIYSSKCTQETNPDKPKCMIKGNMNENSHEKIYVVPGCESYAVTKIQLYMGDQWFCTETEAKKAGFVKAGGCN